MRGEAPMLPDHWSHSTLELCIACPAAAAAKFAGEPDVTPANVRSGADLHEAIARYARDCWEKNVRRDREAAARIGAGYGASVEKSLLAFAKDTAWPWRKMKAGADAPDECPVEQLWECDLPNGARFVGRIDLCLVERGAGKDNPFAESDDRVTIIDWKQGRPPTWNDPDPATQLLRYGVMYRRNHPAQHDMTLMYGAPGWQGKWALKEWQVGRVELDRAEAQLCAAIDRFREAQEWPANPGPDTCPGCFYAAACPLRDSDTFRELTAADPEELVRAVAWHGAQGKRATGLLQGIAKANDGEAAGHGWNPTTSLRPVMDEDAFGEYCRSRGHTVRELQSVTWDKRRVAKAEWLEEGLLEEVATGKRWGPLKAAQDDPAGDAGEGE